MISHHAMTDSKLKVKCLMSLYTTLFAPSVPFYQYIHDIQLLLKYIDNFAFYLQYKSLLDFNYYFYSS